MMNTQGVSNSGSVVMIYGLSGSQFNCDHLFNLLCSYGNVLKVVSVGGMHPVSVIVYVYFPFTLGEDADQ